MDKTAEISEAIKNVIKTLMDRVMENVLINDPFIKEKHRAEKPLYAALVPDEIFKGSHFERRFVTPFGKVWEKLAAVAAQASFGHSEVNKNITGSIPEDRLNRITEILLKLEHTVNGKDKIKPNWDIELEYIMKGKGKLYPITVICDVYAEDIIYKNKFAFEIKSPLPNSDITKVSKEKLLKLYAMEPRIIDEAYFALPYNPYGKKENYNWMFPFRWFDMKNDKSVLIWNEFWDKIGGIGTYQYFIREINKIGKDYKTRIYREFLGMEPLADDFELIID